MLTDENFGFKTIDFDDNIGFKILTCNLDRSNVYF